MEDKELRRAAIDRYLGGEPPKSIYDDLGRTKQWFFKWLKRYQTGDPDWFLSRSKAPKRRATEISKTTRDQIVNIRQRLQRQHFAQVGVSAIKWELHKKGVPLPSDRTISRVIQQEGLIKKKPLRSKRG